MNKIASQDSVRLGVISVIDCRLSSGIGNFADTSDVPDVEAW